MTLTLLLLLLIGMVVVTTTAQMTTASTTTDPFTVVENENGTVLILLNGVEIAEFDSMEDAMKVIDEGHNGTMDASLADRYGR